jgi:hypothetical protein
MMKSDIEKLISDYRLRASGVRTAGFLGDAEWMESLAERAMLQFNETVKASTVADFVEVAFALALRVEELLKEGDVNMEDAHTAIVADRVAGAKNRVLSYGKRKKEKNNG